MSYRYKVMNLFKEIKKKKKIKAFNSLTFISLNTK